MWRSRCRTFTCTSIQHQRSIHAISSWRFDRSDRNALGQTPNETDGERLNTSPRTPRSALERPYSGILATHRSALAAPSSRPLPRSIEPAPSPHTQRLPAEPNTAAVDGLLDTSINNTAQKASDVLMLISSLPRMNARTLRHIRFLSQPSERHEIPRCSESRSGSCLSVLFSRHTQGAQRRSVCLL